MFRTSPFLRWEKLRCTQQAKAHKLYHELTVHDQHSSFAECMNAFFSLALIVSYFYCFGKHMFCFYRTYRKSVFYHLFPDLSIPVNNIFCAGQGDQSHRSSRMELLCGDSNLRTKSKLKSVRKTCRGIHINTCCINLI